MSNLENSRELPSEVSLGVNTIEYWLDRGMEAGMAQILADFPPLDSSFPDQKVREDKKDN